MIPFACGRNLNLDHLAGRQGQHGGEIVIEGRGIWIHDSTCRELGGARIARECREHGLNILLPKVPWLTGPNSDPEYWKDVIGPMIAEAHTLGIEVHAWIFFLNDASVDNETSLMQVLETGKVERIACPANPETVKKNVEKIGPILAEYELDGLSLEDCFVYHRFAEEPATCFCDYCKANAPHDPDERVNWNRTRLTNMLREIVEESRKLSPGIKMSAAARAPYVSHGLAMSTDWKEWCELGLLDYLAPMIYETDNARMRDIAEETLRLVAPSRVPVYIGLGAYRIDRELTGHDVPNQLSEQIAITRELKAQGQVFYHMGGITVDQYIEMERAYGERATPPYLKR